MTRPRAHVGRLAEVKPRDYLIRFAFGGTIAVGCGLVGHEAGPAIGGLFLAFPAILPASLTLVHARDGRSDAIAEVRGARVATVGLAAFALVFAGTVARVGTAASLALATVAWCAGAIAAWCVVLAGVR